MKLFIYLCHINLLKYVEYEKQIFNTHLLCH